LISRRKHGEPVAYLRGYVEWFAMRLEVGPAVLVPRPETELLAERAIGMVADAGLCSVVDVGTGSGAIAIALASSCPSIRVTAVDADNRAVDLARRNVVSLGLEDRVTVVQGNLLEPVRERPDLILANLPYLSEAMMTEIDADVRHEPVRALLGGSTGLELYGELFNQMMDRDWKVPALLEIDPRQASLVRHTVEEQLPEWAVVLVRDYAGLDRIVVLEP
jgi:release factor glutamine methyltransferase